MKILPPNLPIGQSFGQNATKAYAADGLLGHPGMDFGSAVNWGQPILAVVPATVSCILSQNNKNLAAYRAVNTIYDQPDGCYEIQYGHISTTDVRVGDNLLMGDEVAKVGNTGDVFAPNLITEAQKEAGSHAGAHIHLQVRKILKEANGLPFDASKRYLNDGMGLLVLNGYRYYQALPNNGYNSCVDPKQFFITVTPPTPQPPAPPPLVVPIADIQASVEALSKVKDPSAIRAIIQGLINILKSII